MTNTANEATGRGRCALVSPQTSLDRVTCIDGRALALPRWL